MIYSIAVLPGDGIGPEIIEQAVRVLTALDISLNIQNALIGGSAFDAVENPLPIETLNLVKKSHATLFGAVGDQKYNDLPRELRPEQGLLKLRKELDLFANLRPIVSYYDLSNVSTLKKEIILNLDILIIRELIGDIYFGIPKGLRYISNGISQEELQGFDTMCYSESEIRRIAKISFEFSKTRRKKLCSIDKANVLETSQLWRKIIIEVSKEYPCVELSHMYVDNAAMQLIKNPSQFDVIVTGNLFGDILSDEAAMLTGSIGMLPSASLNLIKQGLYEPCHGSAPDIAGKGISNPLGMILSSAMLLRYSLNMPKQADYIELAVQNVLKNGFRTKDIYEPNTIMVNTSGMGDAILKELSYILN